MIAKKLIFGANGQLGSSLMKQLDNTIGLTREDVDVRNFEKVREVRIINIDDN